MEKMIASFRELCPFPLLSLWALVPSLEDNERLYGIHRGSPDIGFGALEQDLSPDLPGLETVWC